MFKNIFNIKHKKFNIETYNNILEECKTKKWVTNISDLKDIALYYDDFFPNEINKDYLLKDNINIRIYLINFFCINKQKLQQLYYLINGIKINKELLDKNKYANKFTKEILEQILNECNTKKWTINLKILKKIANLYNELYPNELESNYLENDNIYIRSYLTTFFCKNKNKIIKLYNILNIENYPDIIEVLSDKPKKDKPIIPIDVISFPKKTDTKKADLKKKDEDKKIDDKKDDDKEIKLQIKKIEPPYLKDIKKEYIELDSKDFTQKTFEEDIAKDSFIKKLIESNIKALEFKYLNYTKLLTKQLSSNMEIIISTIIENINEKIKNLKNNPNIIAIKRKELQSVLNDPNNGILSIKGVSREQLRISLIKLIYIYIRNPILFFKSFNNIILSGLSGSGKNSIIKVLIFIFNTLGILLSSNLIIASKNNLNDIDNINNLIENALEGIIYIDEIYNITGCKKEIDLTTDQIIRELIGFMDKFIGCLIIIISGNKEKLNECFFKINDGLIIRFPKQIDLLPYTSIDIYNIFYDYISAIINYNEEMTIENRKYIKEMIFSLNNKEVFTNQSLDMLNLSSLIVEDFILYENKYNIETIKLTFKKFLISKNIAIDFL